MRTDTFDAKLALILSALPFGWIGVVAMMLVAAGAFALGQIAFFGLEFLTHWPLFLGGWFAGLVVLSAIWGTGIECFVWSRGLAYAAISRQVAHFVFAAYIVLLGIWWLAHQEFQCLHVTMPFLGLLVFGITVVFQYPIIQPFRDAGRDRAAFAVLLILEALMMFLNGETMAIDHYRKGLVHFQEEHRPIWSIPSSDRADFFFDFERKEVVLKALGTGDPLEVRRSFADFKCQ
jgi:hypothetical protein